MDELLIKPTGLVQLKQKLAQWLSAPAEGLSDEPQAPVSQEAVAPPPLDLAFVAAMCGGERAAMCERLQGLRRANHQDALLLGQAVVDDDLARVTQTAHRMLGSSSIMKARDVADACRRIVHASRAGDSETVAEVLEALQREISRLNAYIDSVCAEPDKTNE